MFLERNTTIPKFRQLPFDTAKHSTGPETSVLKQCRRKVSWPNFKYYTDVHMEAMRETTTILSRRWFSIWGKATSKLVSNSKPNLYFHHHHISVMELGQLLTHSGLTYPEVSSKICHESFCQLGNSVSLPWVIYYEAFYLHVVSSFSCIPVITCI
jgi:hypothetical protein